MKLSVREKTVNELKLPKKIDWKKLAWDTLSLLVRTEANYECEFHKKIQEKNLVSPCVCNGVMQCCHKITRKKLSIKFDRRNNLCGCSGSNAWAHNNELAWDKLWRQLYPEDIEFLEMRVNRIVHFKNWDYKIMIDEYKKKLEEL